MPTIQELREYRADALSQIALGEKFIEQQRTEEQTILSQLWSGALDRLGVPNLRAKLERLAQVRAEIRRAAVDMLTVEEAVHGYEEQMLGQMRRAAGMEPDDNEKV